MLESQFDDDADPSMEAFDEAFRLVGQFMCFWGALEGEINRSVQSLLNLKGIEGAIATANIQVRDKLHIIKTALNLAPESDWLKAANKTLEQIGSCNGDRNIVAHTMFGPHENGGVRFYTVKAKGKFSMPDTIWSAEEFAEKVRNMVDLQRRLKDIAYSVALIRAHDELLLQSALLGFAPTPSSGQQGILGLPGSRPQDDQHSPPATPETAP